jgi:hypothetical protein
MIISAKAETLKYGGLQKKSMIHGSKKKDDIRDSVSPEIISNL